MLDAVVRHLYSSGVPFRLSSQSPAPPTPRGTKVDTQFVLIAARLALIAFPSGLRPDHAALSNTLGAVVLEVPFEDLPDVLRGGPVPPLGTLFGVPLVVDERLATESDIIAFQAFRADDWFDLAYDDFARLETPRVVAFATGGELTERAP